ALAGHTRSGDMGGSHGRSVAHGRLNLVPGIPRYPSSGAVGRRSAHTEQRRDQTLALRQDNALGIHQSSGHRRAGRIRQSILVEPAGLAIDDLYKEARPEVIDTPGTVLYFSPAAIQISRLPSL